nr:reverse transcriptase domain-containing protein [Tanacetum cinerariifolium]
MQSFSPDLEISYPPLGDEDGAKGPMIIEAEIGGHFIHHIYVDRGSASEILYEHCFNRLCPKVKNQMVSATAPLIGFSREIIWPMGQMSLQVKIGDGKHSTSTWMNFVVVRSPSPYNVIIGRPGVRKFRQSWGSATLVGALAECPGRMPSSQTKEKKPSIREKQGNTRGSRKTCRRRHHEGSQLPRLVIKSGNEAAFKQMKKLITELPTLTAPVEKEELIVYLAAAREAVSAVLMIEREAKQMSIYFVSRDEDGAKGPMIIEAEIGGHFIHHIYVDRGSASEILYEHCFNRLCPKVKNQMVSATAPLIGFSREIIWPMGQMSLQVKIGDGKHSTSTWMNFVVVRSPSPYNVIIGRPGVRKFRQSWTESTAFRHHSICKGKDQSSNSLRISKASNCNRLHPNRGRAEGVVWITQA